MKHRKLLQDGAAVDSLMDRQSVKKQKSSETYLEISSTELGFMKYYFKIIYKSFGKEVRRVYSLC